MQIIEKLLHLYTIFCNMCLINQDLIYISILLQLCDHFIVISYNLTLYLTLNSYNFTD